jgi:NitT/TauT family transport system substrate-binding protein
MKTYRLILVLAVLLTLSSLALEACAPSATPSAAPATVAPATTAEMVTLNIATLPILDTLPMYVAQQEGLFDKNGVKVEFIPASSAAERDQIFAAGKADGMINDSVSTVFYNKDAPQIQIVRFAQTATPTTAQYQILASPKSGIDSAAGLKGTDIGVSQGTVIQYVTERLLNAEGLSAQDIKTIAVPKISDRMTLLSSGELKAATLPEPFSSLAVQQGAKVVLDDTKHPEYGYSVYSFSKALIDEHPEAVRGFLAAIEDAIKMINADPTKWDNLLTEKQLVPAPLMGKFKIPTFPTASILSQAQWEDMLAWVKEKGLIQKDLPYDESVNASFLP